jgi:peroxin-3
MKALTQMAQEEQMRETLEGQLSMTNLLFGGAFSVQALLSETLNFKDDDAISELEEARFLTMSWWILHVGWKDIAERVRKGVEEVFEGYVFNHYSEPI